MIVYNGPFRDGHRRFYGKKSSVVFVNLKLKANQQVPEQRGRKGSLQRTCKKESYPNAGG